ncbi:MAG: hypothetical protein JWM19_1612 [Actinomycetia bacterium]|nr:hypothetical protein [Actinomycetes bacterium]
MANKASRSAKGLVGGLALLVATGLAMAGLSGCGAPAYTYVADSANSTYYKVPTGWHALSQASLDHVLTSGGGSVSGIWVSGFDAGKSPSAGNFLSFGLNEPFVFSEVIPLSQQAVNGLSYDGLRDFMLPVSSTGRQAYASSGNTLLSGFTQVRDDTVTAANGVHGVRETFEYTYNGVSDTFDEVALTNADQTVVYFLMLHCTDACYSANEANINTIMSSFTVGSPS